MPIQVSEKRRTTQNKLIAIYRPPKNRTSTSYTGALQRLVYSYSSDTVQSGTIAPKTWYNHNLAVPILDDAAMPEVINQAPFVLRSKGATYYVRVLVRFEKTVGLERWILAVRRNTHDAEIPIFAALEKTDPNTNAQFLEMVLEDDFFFVADDEMRVVLRCYNDSGTSKILNITFAQIMVAVLQ